MTTDHPNWFFVHREANIPINSFFQLQPPDSDQHRINTSVTCDRRWAKIEQTRHLTQMYLDHQGPSPSAKCSPKGLAHSALEYRGLVLTVHTLRVSTGLPVDLVLVGSTLQPRGKETSAQWERTLGPHSALSRSLSFSSSLLLVDLSLLHSSFSQLSISE